MERVSATVHDNFCESSWGEWCNNANVTMPSQSVPQIESRTSDGIDREEWPKELDRWRAEFFGESVPSGWEPVSGFENVPLDMGQLKVKRKLTSGSMGPLYVGTYEGRQVVAKLVWPSNSIGKNFELDVKHVLREVGMLSRVNHENVVEFVGACYKHPVYCVVMEYLPKGSLNSLIKSRCKPLPIETIVSLASDIAKGMAHLHNQGVIHRDLKPDNLLVDGHGRIKVADFGSSTFEKDTVDLLGETGTYRWMAPEVIGHKKYGRKVDVYSFGLILWQLICLELPFNGLNPVQTAFAVLKGKRPCLPTWCPGELSGLVRRCWETNPKRRPEFCAIIQTLQKIGQEFSRGDDAPSCFPGFLVKRRSYNQIQALTTRELPKTRGHVEAVA